MVQAMAQSVVSSKAWASGIEVWGRGLDGFFGSWVLGSCGSELKVLVFWVSEV